ncbi:MAG: MoaD/ThiS family protein [Deltaproteobacteria bacterium]
MGVGVNGEVVRRAAWATALQPDDEVEILVATAGG